MGKHDREFMARALRLAGRGLFTTDPNPRVGCVIVKDGRVAGEGWHECAGEAHAEIHALKAAGSQARGATVYVTLEPCSHHGRTPPCAEALVEAGVEKVVVAMQDPNPAVSGSGIARLREAGIATVTGVLEAQARELNPGFISRMERGRPWVCCKFGMSLDGRTAMASGESRWITSPEARTDVHRLRARSSVILTGIGTVLADDPRMDARLDGISVRQPLRVVVDSRLRMPVSAKLLLNGDTLIASCDGDAARAQALRDAGAEIVAVASNGGRVDLAALMKRLGEREINEVLLESGPALAGAMYQAGLIDEFVFYMAPKIMGANARGLFDLPLLTEMSQVPELEILDIRAVGPDWRIRARPARSE